MRMDLDNSNRIGTLKTSTSTSSNEFKDMKFDGKFVGQLIFEWVRRMKAYSDFTLSNSIIQSMAIQFKLVLNMTWFFPTTAWINRFRATYNLRPAYTTKIKNPYKEKKSVQVRDIIHDLMHTAKPKEPSMVQVTQESAAPCNGPDIAIIEIEDEVKREYDEVINFDIPHSDAPSAGVEEAIIDESAGLPSVTQIADNVTEHIEVVDFEKELPSSVVLNYITQKESEDVIDDVLNRDDMEDFIPALVCSSKELKVEKPKKIKLRIPATERAARVTNHSKNKPDDIPAKRMRSATSSATPVENIRKEAAESVSLLVPIPELADVDLSETIETASVPAQISLKTYSIPSTVTIKKISLSPEIPRKPTRFLNRQPLRTREEALKCIKLMEEFALMKENFRLIGFIERLEKLLMNGN